ncbi:MAG: transglutaminase family protein [Bacteroidaceae bacterium]|nr:transglutaminase family protein [Bacteroidaceae bacterium]
MKRNLILAVILIAMTVAVFVATTQLNAASSSNPELNEAIASSTRPEALQKLLKQTDKEYRNELAYLLIHMPEADRDTMSLDLLVENVRMAHQVRKQYPWAQALPEEVYLTDVLPYYVVDEVRDAWREELYELFAPAVDTCSTLEEAIRAVNSNIPALTGVHYNTLREKTNQSPRESMRQGMASCTGLSILLVDAYRAVGIPARFVGTASWHDNRGNHSWTEVWLDGQWRVTEYYFPSQLDHLWFMADASKANPADRRYAIYATRFGEAPDWFPMVWCGEDSTAIENLPKHIGAENVTQHYIDLAREQQATRIEAGTHTYLRIVGYAKREATHHSADRVAMGVDIFHGTEQMGGGLTAGPHRDMNDNFSLLLPKNATYELRYYDTAGNLKTQAVTLGEEPMTVAIYQE